MSVRQRKHTKATPTAKQAKQPQATQPTTLKLIVCVVGIYATFLTWAVLQERISTTPYGSDNRIFKSSYTVTFFQSLFAFVFGVFFVRIKKIGPLWPKNTKVLKQYGVIALCQSLSAPLSYNSLHYVDYVTMLLAKSCKLLPVMAVHLTLYKKRFPRYKYLVVLFVTLGVSLFSLYQSSNKQMTSKVDFSKKIYGFGLLSLSLFLDGLYNTTQDEMFTKFKGEVSGPQMMAVMNLFTCVYAALGIISSRAQVQEVLFFLRNHPQVFRDIVMFAACGALGQIFIFITLEQFGSLVLVTTTVTRKMVSMLLSVVMFNHRLSAMQWLGVALVFGGIGGETLYKLSR